jgi:hypothetical protein
MHSDVSELLENQNLSWVCHRNIRCDNIPFENKKKCGGGCGNTIKYTGKMRTGGDAWIEESRPGKDKEN